MSISSHKEKIYEDYFLIRGRSQTTYSHLSNKRGAHAYQFWKIPPSSKKNPPSSFIDFITKVSDIIAEPDDNFSHDHFEL